MRILHTSDWHLGKRLESFSRIDEQRLVMNEICQIAIDNQVDAVVVAGDLFDTINPPTEAVELLYQTLKRLTNNGQRPVIAIAGNHDSPDRIEAPDPLARECGIVFVGYPHSLVSPFSLESGVQIKQSAPGFIELLLPQTSVPLRVVTTPYANEVRLRTCLSAENSEQQLRDVLQQYWLQLSENHLNSNGVNILATHLFVVKDGDPMPEEPEDEKPILYVGGAQAVYTSNFPSQVQYVALGHLHRKQIVDEMPCPVVYSGSPLAYSFSEANQEKYVMIVDVEPGQIAEVKAVQLKSCRRLIRKRFEQIDEAIIWLQQNQDVYVELTIVSDNYLSAVERKQLNDAHELIVAIIPEVRHVGEQANSGLTIDVTRSIDELFVDYFKYKKGQNPDERMMNLFKEVLAEEKQ
jgi:exonuclease SbcD